MDDKDIRTLADILVQSHAENAASVARARSVRCARMLEKQWSATWLAVAEHISDAAKPRSTAAELQSTGSLNRCEVLDPLTLEPVSKTGGR
jgi:hypothetical protein